MFINGGYDIDDDVAPWLRAHGWREKGDREGSWYYKKCGGWDVNIYDFDVTGEFEYKIQIVKEVTKFPAFYCPSTEPVEKALKEFHSYLKEIGSKHVALEK